LPHAVFIDHPQAGAPVVLGLRPEHIALRPNGDAAQVTLVEPMGSHAVVWLDLHGQRLAASVPASEEPALGSSVGFDLDLARACVFDPESEQRL
jgi:multiple sugar transport system ATP-binding protein